jgi:hypothetical protein
MLRGVPGGAWLDALGAQALYVEESGRVGGRLADVAFFRRSHRARIDRRAPAAPG